MRINSNRLLYLTNCIDGKANKLLGDVTIQYSNGVATEGDGESVTSKEYYDRVFDRQADQFAKLVDVIVATALMRVIMNRLSIT